MGKTELPTDLLGVIRQLQRDVAELRRGHVSTLVARSTTATSTYLRGINLSGLDFAPAVVPGVAGTNFFAPAAGDYAYFRGRGMSIVRIPFTWDRAQPFLYGDLDPTYMGLVDAAVANTAANGMVALLDLHSYGRRYVPVPGGFTNDFTTSAGTWSGGTLSGGRYITDQNTYFTAMSAGDARNPQTGPGYALTLDTYITDELSGGGNFPALWIRVMDNMQPAASATYYQLTISRFEQKFKWSKVVGGVVTDIGAAAAFINLNTLYTVTIDVGQATAGQVAITVNGSPVATFPTDAAITHGRVSVTTSFTKAAIDNVTLNVGGDTTAADASGTFRVGDAQIPVGAFADVWGKLAARYLNNAAVWGFDLMNEPHDMPTPTTPATYASSATVTLMYQAAIDTIRLIDPSRWIVLNLDQWSGFQSFVGQYGANPNPWWRDPSGKTMVGAHYYQDSDHSGSYHTAWDQTLRDRIPGEVTPLLTWAAAQGVSVFAGEYGVPFRTGTDADNWRADLGTFLALLDAYQAHGTYWAGGSHYTASTSVEPRTAGVVDYTTASTQMPVITAHLSGKVSTSGVGGGGTGITAAGPYSNVLTSDGQTWVSRPSPRGFMAPGDSGYVAWALDPAACVSSTAMTTGLLYMIRLKLEYPALITGATVYVVTAGSGLTSGQNLAGLYSTTGALLATSGDQTVPWASAGEKAMGFTTTIEAQPGYLHIGLLANGATGPALARGASSGSQVGNAGLAISQYRFAQSGTGQTALPTSVTMTGRNNGTGFWVGLLGQAT